MLQPWKMNAPFSLCHGTLASKKQQKNLKVNTLLANEILGQKYADANVFRYTKNLS